ncbi:angiotensin-converting enzyme 2-like [Dama dama]
MPYGPPQSPSNYSQERTLRLAPVRHSQQEQLAIVATPPCRPQPRPRLDTPLGHAPYGIATPLQPCLAAPAPAFEQGFVAGIRGRVGALPPPTLNLEKLSWQCLSWVQNGISHVLLCNVTQQVSFWFVVTDPSRNHTLPAVEVQSAIRMNRNRINNAFFLNDQTLEFLRIPSTLAPPTDPSVPIWIIIFGVIFCIVLVATMLLILSGIRQHRR